MATVAASPKKPDYCPVCDESYIARVPNRYDERIKLVLMYRHRANDAYVYLHRISYIPGVDTV